MLVAWLVLGGCSTPPAVESISPQELPAGEVVQVHGRNFADGLELALDQDGHEVPLEDVRVLGLAVAEGRVPRDVGPGVYDVVLTAGEETARLPGAVTIDTAKDELPCSGQYTRNTRMSLARHLVVVDRFGRDGGRESIVVSTDDVSDVEYQSTKDPSGGPCFAIWLREADGRRVLWDEDKAEDLKERAYKLGQAMGKPVAPAPSEAAASADNDTDEKKPIR